MIDEKNLIEIMLKIREREHGTPKGMIDWFIQVIEACPKLNEWTSVSKGLPSKYKHTARSYPVLVTYLSALDGKPISDSIAHYDFFDDSWKWDEDDEDVRVKITAWKYLPEPYKED